MKKYKFYRRKMEIDTLTGVVFYTYEMSLFGEGGFY